jgi:hypothetical protein
MENPYESPPELPRTSLLKRLRRGLALALAEYRYGLKRDNFSFPSLVRAWASLLVVTLIMFAFLVFVVLFLLDRFGILEVVQGMLE